MVFGLNQKLLTTSAGLATGGASARRAESSARAPFAAARTKRGASDGIEGHVHGGLVLLDVDQNAWVEWVMSAHGANLGDE